MKKIILSSCFIVLAWGSVPLFGNESEKQDTRFTTALTAGYVFKRGCTFKDVYGHGVVNIITADGCYFPWESWGIGAKVSYWRKKGETTFLKQCTRLQQVPITVYVRGRHNFSSRLQAYASLGAGAIWTQEKSYLSKEQFFKGIGEVEVGGCYSICKHFNFTTAFRYLFPQQSHCRRDKVEIGGFDSRAGFEFPF